MLDIRLGAPQAHDHLTVFPLLAGAAPELPYALLADALAAGTLRIGEVGQGTVPTLLAHNTGDADVLLLDGEQLIGSRQNRTTNRSILLPARSKVEIPVSCMEHGRWHFVSEAMRAAPQHSPAKVRRHARSVEARYAAVGAPPSPRSLSEAQGAVWDEIADTAAKLGARTETGAMDAIYLANADRLEEMERAFPPVPAQVGLLAFAGPSPGDVIGLDLVGGRALYARLHARLLRGYLLDALDRAADRAGGGAGAGGGSRSGAGAGAGAGAGGGAGARAGANLAAAQAYLDSVRLAPRAPAPTVGKGSYAVLTGRVIGGELLDGERVVHLSAFPGEEHERGERDERVQVIHEAPLARPSERRRRGPRAD